MQWLTSGVVVTIVVVPPTPGPHVPFDVTGNVVQHVATDLHHGQCTDRTTNWSWVHEILCHTRTWRWRLMPHRRITMMSQNKTTTTNNNNNNTYLGPNDLRTNRHTRTIPHHFGPCIWSTSTCETYHMRLSSCIFLAPCLLCEVCTRSHRCRAPVVHANPRLNDARIEEEKRNKNK